MRREIAYALRRTAPVACGYIFLGMAFGILLNEEGYGPLWALASSLFVYAGSMQFVMVSLLAAGAPLYTVAVTTFLVNARHIFYGLGFIEKYRGMGRRFPYMVFSLTDETYSVLCSMDPPEGLDWNDCAFYASLLDHAYWVIGSVLGAALGQAIPVDLTGIDFSMTALFVVIFVDQWKAHRPHLPAVVGTAVSFASLLVLGSEQFILPAMLLILGVLTLLRRPLSGKGADEA